MIEHRRGSLLDSDADALVNTVNTVGVMGKGVALQFRQAFPGNYKAYRAACNRGDVQLGRMFVFRRTAEQPPRFIVNFPTKRHWRSRSRLMDIERGLNDLVCVIRDLGIKSIAVPALGCGNGGLRWSDVCPLIESALGDLDIPVAVYPPQRSPAAESMPVRTATPPLTPSRAALVGLLARYLEPGFGASLLEVQKLAYLLQAAGELLKLDFARGPYGPYAEPLNHVLQRLEGHYIRGYGDRSKGSASIRVMPGALAALEVFLGSNPETLERYERVAVVINGFENPYGLELLTTLHWIGREYGDKMPTAVVCDLVGAWSARKARLFRREHIETAWQRLRAQGWLREPAALIAAK